MQLIKTAAEAVPGRNLNSASPAQLQPEASPSI